MEKKKVSPCMKSLLRACHVDFIRERCVFADLVQVSKDFCKKKVYIIFSMQDGSPGFLIFLDSSTI